MEITDARIPFSSRNPEMKRIVGSKPRLVLLNKADSADPEVTAMWLDYYAKQGITALATDCRSGKNVSKFYGKLKELLKDDIEKWNAKGMSGRPIRIMIVGIPNVGKSSFINRLAGSRLAKVEDRPGVTRGKQWVKLDEGFELLDMPGVLWPKFEDKLVGERLAFTGAVFELLERIGRKRGFLVSGGEINTERAAITVMDEFRNGTLGRLTLEKPKGY